MNHPTVPVDAFDLVGVLALGLIVAGVNKLYGWPWAAILVGSLLLCVYLVRAVREIAGSRRRS